ncbi:hypothetical protein GCM10010990_29250 [Croceicoccus mobilis]|uniref:HPr kinase/phosphorylase C-terminal domain-containing protein n=2 Tax=Croceicoccus mobilis TaxID=1703339 RepID=A0A916Z5F5_9SPHN|nr:hypothetical protein GCM10010990_29250 [Croceicoccus mobilis]
MSGAPCEAKAMQATVVAVNGRGVLITGEPGVGKTSLALALIDRGAQLVGDDGVMVAARDGAPFAWPHPNTAGMIEIRNVGIVHIDAVPAPIALSIELTRDAPRHVEGPAVRKIADIPVPTLTMWPDSPVLALRVEWALRMHGASESRGA